MASISHSGGIVEAVLELGFDQVKYFETTVTDTASGFTMSVPARRIIVENIDADNSVFLRVNGGDAVANATFVPGDNIRIRPGCSFAMDFDSVSSISLITESGISVDIIGLLGFKGTVC